MSTPTWNQPRVNPRLVFDRLFQGGTPDKAAQAERARRRQSVLDFVREDARQLQGRLGSNDCRKLEEYLAAIREVETRLDQGKAPGTSPPDYPRPGAAPADYPEHIRIMCDLLVLAFQTDSTRVATLLFANEFSNRSYPFIGVSGGHHELSHHGGNPNRTAAIKKINRFHAGLFAYLLGKFRSVRKGNGTLLDHCLIAYGSGNSDGNTHSHADLPILLAGLGGRQSSAGPPHPLPGWHAVDEPVAGAAGPAERAGASHRRQHGPVDRPGRLKRVTWIGPIPRGKLRREGILPVVSEDTPNANIGSRVVGATRPDTGMPTNAVLFPQAVRSDVAKGQGRGDRSSTGSLGRIHAPFICG